MSVITISQSQVTEMSNIKLLYPKSHPTPIISQDVLHLSMMSVQISYDISICFPPHFTSPHSSRQEEEG